MSGLPLSPGTIAAFAGGIIGIGSNGSVLRLYLRAGIA
ncbi:hypothetical protein L1278_003257 [Pontibacter sp. HSC-36F09]|nr:hypothetical protein [Pontibacter sp. HSC-36F09]